MYSDKGELCDAQGHQRQAEGRRGRLHQEVPGGDGRAEGRSANRQQREYEEVPSGEQLREPVVSRVGLDDVIKLALRYALWVKEWTIPSGPKMGSLSVARSAVPSLAPLHRFQPESVLLR